MWSLLLPYTLKMLHRRSPSSSPACHESGMSAVLPLPTNATTTSHSQAAIVCAVVKDCSDCWLFQGSLVAEMPNVEVNSRAATTQLDFPCKRKPSLRGT
ncbi:hypothetical protein O3P69_020674 [Scylla paramamosain]|uniref:Secreted protein n=1 Tax=Scylla paramamosain TaxID=85552 RepID=A0AAW0TNS8_SCYPA